MNESGSKVKKYFKPIYFNKKIFNKKFFSKLIVICRKFLPLSR